jgi:hypothetical protein
MIQALSEVLRVRRGVMDRLASCGYGLTTLELYGSGLCELTFTARSAPASPLEVTLRGTTEQVFALLECLTGCAQNQA